jgi:hypothetical protein
MQTVQIHRLVQLVEQLLAVAEARQELHRELRFKAALVVQVVVLLIGILTERVLVVWLHLGKVLLVVVLLLLEQIVQALAVVVRGQLAEMLLLTVLVLVVVVLLTH